MIQSHYRSHKGRVRALESWLPNKGIWKIIPNRRLFTNKGIFIATLYHHLFQLLFLPRWLPKHTFVVIVCKVINCWGLWGHHGIICCSSLFIGTGLMVGDEHRDGWEFAHSSRVLQADTSREWQWWWWANGQTNQPTKLGSEDKWNSSGWWS